MKTLERGPLAPQTPRDILARLDQFVIGQSRAKRVVALAAYNHAKRVKQAALGPTRLKKSNILLAGPTGSGKTHIARSMAKVLDLPFVVVDATEYTEAGYYGKDVEVMVAELLFSCGHNVPECERGIIFIDEVDKIARRSGGMRTGAGARDIGGEGVQQGLLKLLEGRRIFVPLNVTQHWSKHDFVEVDTTNILFICAGTFTDARSFIEQPIGFGQVESGPRTPRQRLGHKQLLDYGMLPEFLGRLPLVAQLDPLSQGDLVRILTEPVDCLLGEYQELFAADGVTLRFGKEALNEVAGFAERRRIGARGLRAIMEEVLHEELFDAPENGGKTVRVSREFVRRRLERFDSGMIE